jgi:hypothetical protein
MKIISIKWKPLALIFSIIYAAFGFLCFLQFEYTDMEYLTMPVGFVAFLVHLNFNFNLQRPNSIFLMFAYGIGSIVSFAITGWISGGIAALGFNLVAKLTGGVDAEFVDVADELAPTKID